MAKEKPPEASESGRNESLERWKVKLDDRTRELLEAKTEAQREAAIKAFEQTWKKAFLAVGFDVDTGTKLDGFQPSGYEELVQYLEETDRRILAALGNAQQERAFMERRLQVFGDEVGVRWDLEDREVLAEQPPLLELTFENPAKTPLRLRGFEGFDPQVKPGNALDLRTMGLGGLYQYDSLNLNFKASLLADDPETPVNEGVQRIADYLLKDYLPKHPEALSAFGIQDVRHLTPRQAIQLISYILIERIKYSHQQAELESMEGQNEALINDTAPIDQLFSWQNDESGIGVCRNYAEVAAGLLEALKQVQSPEESLLNTTHAVVILKPWGVVPGDIDQHAWNGFVTVTEEGVDAVVTDFTWADSDSATNDPSRLGSDAIQLDYTRERALSLVHYFEESRFFEPARLADQFETSYRKASPATYPEITQENWKNEIDRPPMAYFAGARFLQLANGLPPLPEDKRPAAEAFCVSYANDLEARFRQCEEDITNGIYIDRDYFHKRMLGPWLENVREFTAFLSSLPAFSEKDALLERVKSLVGRSFSAFGSYWNMEQYNYLYLAEQLHLPAVADSCMDVIRRWSSPHTKWLSEAMEVASPERRSRYAEKFGLDVQESEREPQKKSIEKTFAYVSGLYGKPQVSEPFFATLNGVISSLPFEDRCILKRSSLNVEENPTFFNTDDIDGLRVVLEADFSATDMRDHLIAYARMARAWEKFAANCPCHCNLYTSETDENTFMALLSGMEAYFAQVDEPLVRYIRLSIGTEDNLDTQGRDSGILDHSLTIDQAHFLNREFRAIDALIRNKKRGEHEKYGKLRQAVDAHRLYQQIESYPFVSGVRFYDEDVEQAIALYPELRRALDELQNRAGDLPPVQIRFSNTTLGNTRSGVTPLGRGILNIFKDVTPANVYAQITQAYDLYVRLYNQHRTLEATYAAWSIKVEMPYDEFDETAITQLEQLGKYAEALSKREILQSNDALDIVMGFPNEQGKFMVKLISKSSRRGWAFERKYRLWDVAAWSSSPEAFATKLSAAMETVVRVEKRMLALETAYKVGARYDGYLSSEHAKTLDKGLSAAEHFFSTLENPYLYEDYVIFFYDEGGSDTSSYEKSTALPVYVDRAEKRIFVTP